MKEQENWNGNWWFHLDDQCQDALPEQGVSWTAVQLPHDWQIWRVNDLYKDGTGWYRKILPYAPVAGQRTALYFEGVYQDMTLFVNGAAVGAWKYGYSSFHFDLTEALRPGENEILVRCRAKHPNSRWYSGAGIYRDVWLWRYPEAHLVPHSLYLSPVEEGPELWSVRVQVETALSGNGAWQSGDTVALTLWDGAGQPLAEQRLPLSAATPVAGAAERYGQGERDICALTTAFRVERPALWDVGQPNLYRMTATLLRVGQAEDTLESSFGFRSVELDPERGFLLNHRKVTLHGVCMHHDLGCLGAAFYPAAAERQLKLLLEMGVNAIRTAHNMPAPAVLELADRYGILMVDEAFDCWRKGKNPYDYHRFFETWYQRDVASWVRRDRNHPSVVLWSIGNEVYDTHNDPKGMDTMQALLQEVQRHDPWGNGRATFGSNYLAWENTQRCADVLKVPGYNYGEGLYAAHHAAHPDWVLYGSETASIVASRGIYHFPLSQSLLIDDDLQCSSLGNSRTSWGAKSVEACLAADVEHPYTLGQFVWSGFDYIGEPTPYHTKNSYLGQIDTAGFPKDSFYRYQAGWTDYRAKPMVHLLPYWDFNEGQIIDICVISNAPEVALWVNGVSQGRQKLDTVSQISAHWQAPYHPGSLMAVAYDETGREIARTEERSFGDAAKLTAQVDRTHLAGDGRELVFCAISAVDQDGNPVRNANNRVTVEAMGALTLLGLDNGDSADLDEYKCTTRQLFSGQLLAVAAGRSAGGMGALEITSPGMEPVRVPVMVTPCPQEEGAAPPLPLWLGRAPEQIPVRKIDLTATGQQMTPERPSVEVEARLLPENATLRQVAWRVSDAMGITANGVVLEVLDETHVRLTGVGDGEYRLRCTCNNGREAPQLISTLEVAVSGMGTRYPDPYDYISASHYDHSHGEIGNGNERGIATSRTEMSWVAYDRLDFGKAGADTLTLDVFEMNSLPTPIRFWRGQPYAPGSVMIGEKIYDKPSQWNVYQPETFTLEQRLQGVETLGIELQCKVHLKGFQFARRSRAWDVLPALSRDTIYGDSYQEGERAVCGIGNNVSLIFQGLDFGTVGFRTLTIRGRTPLANNTIHVLFHGPEGESRRILEFAHQADWGDQRFALEPVYGVQDVTFLFLPGSNFDFEQFQFEL